MKAFFMVLPLLASLLAGCASSGVSARIREKASVFETLPPEAQSTIKQGMVDRGFTEDMVYMAIGKPASVETTPTTQGTAEMWTYKNYYAALNAMTPVINSPGQRRQYSIVAAGAPRSGTSIGSTRGGLQTTLDVPDLVACTLRVFFLNGIVAEAVLEPDS
jgi:hypothetical protein